MAWLWLKRKLRRKILWLDTETTGTDPIKNGVVQISGIVEIDGLVSEEFDLRCRPFPGDEVTKEALEVTGNTLDVIMAFPPPMETYHKFTKILGRYVSKYDRTDKFVLAGYYVGLDDNMMRAWFEKCGDKYYGSWICAPKLDIPTYVAELVAHGLRLDNFQLGTLCRECGVPIQAHDAMSDIRATRSLYPILRRELVEMAFRQMEAENEVAAQATLSLIDEAEGEEDDGDDDVATGETFEEVMGNGKDE